MSNVSAIIATSKLHAHKAVMASSALVCIADAEALFSAGDYENAKNRALKSLVYSVGIMSPIYRELAV